MDAPYNPYASPKTSVAPVFSGPSGRYWRTGNLLKMEVGAVLPCRCVKCNGPSEIPVKGRTLYWHPSGWYALILLNLLIYLIVALCVRHKARVAAGLCSVHRQRRNSRILISWLSILGGLLLAFFGGGIQSYYVLCGGAAVMLLGVIVGATGTRVVTPTHMDGQVVTLSGCGEAFLASLPVD